MQIEVTLDMLFTRSPSRIRGGFNQGSVQRIYFSCTFLWHQQRRTSNQNQRGTREPARTKDMDEQRECKNYRLSRRNRSAETLTKQEADMTKQDKQSRNKAPMHATQAGAAQCRTSAEDVGESKRSTSLSQQYCKQGYVQLRPFHKCKSG
jgi:hypothetical protein